MKKNTYIREIAQQIRALFEPDQLPTTGLDYLFDIYALLALSKGEEVTNQDVHNAWSAWATIYDIDNVSLVPYNELADDVKAYDTPFKDAIIKVSKNIVND